MIKKVDVRQSLPLMEQDILQYWQENHIFERSITERADAPVFSFYDGPPFATGLPHYGHIVGQTLKDAVPRYWTMRGYLVERKWGWDCHGLPIENIAEKALGVKQKKDIETMGVAKFNEFCRGTVLEYTEEWRKVTERLGRWADRDHAYKTMDKPYMESVWWVFKQLWNKGLIYEGYRIMHICTRCETTLSQQEVSEGYVDVKDLSATVKFKLEAGQSIGNFMTDENSFILAWTTTPWTLPGNVALAVGEEMEYTIVCYEGANILMASSRVGSVMKEKGYEQVQKCLGKDLVGKKYLPPFDAYHKDMTLENRANGWKIYGASFVTDEDGTGVVHIAPAFGEDDMELSRANKLPFVQHVGMDGVVRPEVKELGGLFVKPKDNPQATDIEVIKYLASKGLLFAKEKYEHSYPHCWRCDIPLINYATSSWFVKVTAIKDEALEKAKDIHWSPSHIKAGRFGKWLEGARDWSISRQRFWASVMPVWRCSCKAVCVFGSVAELEKASGTTVNDLHKHIVDEILVPCETCGGSMKRIPDVLDTWFDSGSMPFAQMHYPFENEEKFEASFPAQFIAEGIDQTRAWFYYLHILSVALKQKPAFRNVVVNGIVLAEDGRKMSKKLKNYPDPMLMFEKYGADTMRLYLLSSPIVSAENLNFSEKDMGEISRNVFRMLWNSYSFLVMYAEIDGWQPSPKKIVSENILDRWMLSELHTLINEVNTAMEAYDIMRATRLFAPFIDQLSNWYIRRSRKRFWKSEDDTDKNNAYQTLYEALITLSQLMAPFTPFIAEEIYRNLATLSPHTTKDSVHLCLYPVANEALTDVSLMQAMVNAREIITSGLQLRARAKIKVRQPLSEALVQKSFDVALIEIMKEELNVKQVSIKETLSQSIEIVTIIIPELKEEGDAREIIRCVQEARKEAGFEVSDRIILGYEGFESILQQAKWRAMIAKEVLAEQVEDKLLAQADFSKIVKIDENLLKIAIKRA
jgi:isoleucyl-tRNA synthetase